MSGEVVIAAPDSVGFVEVADTASAVLQIQQAQVDVLEVRDGDGALVTVLQPLSEVVQIVATPDLIGPAGPQGVAGPEGPQGEPGPQGDTGPYAPTFEMRFNVASAHWVIVHNLDVFPVVSLFDLDGSAISGDVSMPDRNTVIVDFVMPMAGVAIVKA